MHKLILTLGLTAALAACSNEDHTIVAGGPDDDSNVVAEENVVLPPSIASSKTYRCADNTIVKVDWLSDGKSAMVGVADGAAPVLVSAAEAGAAMSGPDGSSLTGTAGAGSVKVSIAGKAAQTCNG